MNIISFVNHAIYNHKALLFVSWMVALLLSVQTVQNQSLYLYILTYYLIWANLEWSDGALSLEKLSRT